MAVDKYGSPFNTPPEDYFIVDGDPMPTGCATGSSLWVLDKKLYYKYSALNINPVTGNGWWPI